MVQHVAALARVGQLRQLRGEHVHAAVDGREGEGHVVGVGGGVDQLGVGGRAHRALALPLLVRSQPLGYHARRVAAVVRVVRAQEDALHDLTVAAEEGALVKQRVVGGEVGAVVADDVELGQVVQQPRVVLVTAR